MVGHSLISDCYDLAREQMIDIEQQIEDHLLNIKLLKIVLGAEKDSSSSSEIKHLIKQLYDLIDQIFKNQDNLAVLLVSSNSKVRKVAKSYHNKISRENLK